MDNKYKTPEIRIVTMLVNNIIASSSSSSQVDLYFGDIDDEGTNW